MSEELKVKVQVDATKMWDLASTAAEAVVKRFEDCLTQIPDDGAREMLRKMAGEALGEMAKKAASDFVSSVTFSGDSHRIAGPLSEAMVLMRVLDRLTTPAEGVDDPCRCGHFRAAHASSLAMTMAGQPWCAGCLSLGHADLCGGFSPAVEALGVGEPRG